MKNVIKFIANRTWLKEDDANAPEPYKKNMPEWYRKAHRYAVDKQTNKMVVTQDGNNVPTWKSCPSLMDMFLSGYVLKTPCDIEFFINEEGTIDCKIEDMKYRSFCTKRPPMDEFFHPLGYYKEHFAWLGDWGVATPPGYSVLYMTPANMFNLPFINTVGIIEGDSVSISGSLPFFIIEGWTGILPAGTPYLHVFPYKRDDWDSEIVLPDKKKIASSKKENSQVFRAKPNGGVYKDKFWIKKEYN